MSLRARLLVVSAVTILTFLPAARAEFPHDESITTGEVAMRHDLDESGSNHVVGDFIGLAISDLEDEHATDSQPLVRSSDHRADVGEAVVLGEQCRVWLPLGDGR